MRLGWQGFGKVAEALVTADFDRVLFAWVARLVPVRVLFAIEVFADDRPGRVLVTEGRDEDITRRARKISLDYAVQDHRQDDVLHAHRGRPDGEIDLVVQEGEKRHDYFRVKYYDAMGTPQEVSAFCSDGPRTVYLGASSLPTGYGPDDIALLQLALPMVLRLVMRHVELAAGDESGEVPGGANREGRLHRLLSEYCPQLTRREAEICTLIVMGYRAEAIGLRLGISPNTVATHRKHAYAKLHISSQTELFGILFTGWSDT